MNKDFEITQERIDTINRAAPYIGTIGDFATWCVDNFDSIDIEESYYIIEDFVKSNEHIVQKISKIKPSSFFSP
jgi:hypothetical protein